MEPRRQIVVDYGFDIPYPWPTFKINDLKDNYTSVVLFDRGSPCVQCLFHNYYFVGFQIPGAVDTSIPSPEEFITTEEQPHPPTQPGPKKQRDAHIDWLGSPTIILRLTLGEKKEVMYDFEPLGWYEHFETPFQMVMDKHAYPPFAYMTTGLRLWMISPQRKWFLCHKNGVPRYPRAYVGYNDDGDLVNEGKYEGKHHYKKAVLVLNALNRIVITPHRISFTLVHQKIWMYVEAKIQDGVVSGSYFGAYASNDINDLDRFGGDTTEEPVHQLEELWPTVKGKRKYTSYGTFPIQPNPVPWVFSLNDFVPVLEHKINLVVNPDTFDIKIKGDLPPYEWSMKQELEHDPTEQPKLDQLITDQFATFSTICDESVEVEPEVEPTNKRKHTEEPVKLEVHEPTNKRKRTEEPEVESEVHEPTNKRKRTEEPAKSKPKSSKKRRRTPGSYLLARILD